METKKIILTGLFASVVAILAQVSIPIPISPVPITVQLFGVFLAGALLGSKWGAAAMGIYLLLGAAGAPVFSAGRGGLHIIFGPTGGYLIGFVIGAYVLGRLIENKAEIGYLRLVSAMLVCLAIIYTVGATQLAFIAGFNLQQVLIAQKT